MEADEAGWTLDQNSVRTRRRSRATTQHAGLIESAGYGNVDFAILAFVNTFEDNCQACRGDLSAAAVTGPGRETGSPTFPFASG